MFIDFAAITMIIASAAPASSNSNSQDGILDTGVYQASTGERFTYSKGIVNGEEVVAFDGNGMTLDAQQMRTYEQETARPVIADELARKAQRAAPNAMFDLAVVLRDRTGGQLAREARQRIQPALDAINKEVKATRRLVLPATSLSPAEERDWVKAAGVRRQLTDAQEERIRELQEQAEAIADTARQDVARRTREHTRTERQRLERLVGALGGRAVGHALLSNILEVRLPAGSIDALSNDAAIVRIFERKAGAPELETQRTSLGLDNGFWADDIDGGVWDVGIQDGGVVNGHPAFANQTFEFADLDINHDLFHGTAVAGIICSNNSVDRGMAYGCDNILVGRSSNSMSHPDWMVSGATDDAEVINVSWGYGRANDTDYDDLDMFYDGLIDDNNVMVTKSCGNNADGTTTITHPAPAYNLISVANILDDDTVSRSDDDIFWDSSRGPTLAGRKKPDITAPGERTSTTNSNWATGDDFIDFGGTSGAAPHVAGAVTLLTQMRGIDSDMMVTKAVIINSADTWTDNGTSGIPTDDGETGGSEWNKVYGWGYIDLNEAYLNGLDYFIDEIDETNRIRYYKGQMFTDEKATLVWNRHVGYNGSNEATGAEALTDLDLRLFDTATGFEHDSSLSYVDNVEQVAAQSNGEKVVRINLFGDIDPDVAVERYALATEENFVEVQGPLLLVTNTVQQPSPGGQLDVVVRVENTGDLPAHQTQLSIDPPAGYSVVDSSLVNVGTVPAGGSAETTFTLNAPCSTLASLFTTRARSFSYGTNWEDESGFYIIVPSTTTLTSDDPLLADQVPLTYDFFVGANEWAICALDPIDANRDLWGDDTQCVTSPFEESTYGDRTDFVVVNTRNAPAGDYYAEVTDGPDGDYIVEFEVARPLAVGASEPDRIDLDETADLWEANLIAGTEYELKVAPSLGGADVSLFVYGPARDLAERANADRSANSAGVQGVEQITFTPTDSGMHAFAVVRENEGTGIYRISVESLCLCERTSDGSITIDDLLTFLGAWFALDLDADVTADGSVMIDDLLTFLSCWFAGGCS